MQVDQLIAYPVMILPDTGTLLCLFSEAEFFIITILPILFSYNILQTACTLWFSAAVITSATIMLETDTDSKLVLLLLIIHIQATGCYL
jgi:hypothetical protein